MAMSTAAREAINRRMYGTQANREQAPWETYDDEMNVTASMDPKLKLAVENYSKQHHSQTSAYNVEQLCRQKEMSREMVREYRFYRQEEDDLADMKGLRRGRVMSCFEFVDKLNTVIPAYLSANVRKGLTGLAVRKPKEFVQNGQTFVNEWQYVCGVQVGMMHEYSSLHFDSHGLPLNEKWRGWRTVLLRLQMGGFITEKEALDLFGPAVGPASRRYLEQLFCFRNRSEKESKDADRTGRI